MSLPLLFTPLTLRAVTLKNRIVLSPLCMYAARDGVATDFHFSHLTAFARGGVGLVFTEATAVVPEGRISHGCCGIWNDAQVAAYKPIVRAIEALGSVPAIQIAHAGRKASAHPPWRAGVPLTDADATGGSPPWRTAGPTAEPVNASWPSPNAMSDTDVQAMVQSFAAAATRAAQAGFKVLEVHAAHGYLIHSFLSPLANTRNDHYGGDRAGRMRFALEVVEAVRAAWPAELPLFVRISAIDGPAGGWGIEDSIVLARELKSRGVDVVDCSAGGIAGPPSFRASDTGQPHKSNGERPPGFQVPYAARAKAETGIQTMAVGLILEAQQAEAILREGKADLIAIGRQAQFNPNIALHWAHDLGLNTKFEAWGPEYGWWLEKRIRTMQGFATPTGKLTGQA